jgi:hypothetical protein
LFVQLTPLHRRLPPEPQFSLPSRSQSVDFHH